MSGVHCTKLNNFEYRLWGGGRGQGPSGGHVGTPTPRGLTDTTENITFTSPLVGGKHTAKGNRWYFKSHSLRKPSWEGRRENYACSMQIHLNHSLLYIFNFLGTEIIIQHNWDSYFSSAQN